jgi:hypothetical protein
LIYVFIYSPVLQDLGNKPGTVFLFSAGFSIFPVGLCGTFFQIGKLPSYAALQAIYSGYFLANIGIILDTA